jgi:transaldolase
MSYMPTMLEQLRTMTTVVADTGDLNSIHAYEPTDSTTNPSLLETAANMPEYQDIVDDVLTTARMRAGTAASSADVSATAFKTLAVAFGRKILTIVPGRVSTEIDARLSFDRDKTIGEARDVSRQYDEAGVPRERESAHQNSFDMGGNQSS